MPFPMAYVIVNGMTVKVDRAGRIVLPKQVRERLGIQSGCALSLQESTEGILLRPIRQRASLILKRGLLLHPGGSGQGVRLEPYR
jgi:AbrB family looped-hinge helix DNA binding protein